MTKSEEKFVKSVEEYAEKELMRRLNSRGVRIFDDELFVFVEASGGRFRKSSEDYYVISGRGDSGRLSGSRLLCDVLSLNIREKKWLCAALCSTSAFAVMPAGGKVAIIYRGLLGSCSLGVVSLISYHSSLIQVAAGEEFSHLFFDTCFFGEKSAAEPKGEADLFINRIMAFKHEILEVCGRGISQGDHGMGYMIKSAASLVGCDLILRDELRMTANLIDRDTLISLILCILSSVRNVASDRLAEVWCEKVDGDAVVTVIFKTEPHLLEGETRFIDFCRVFSEHYMIPFAYELTEHEGRVSFIPTRIDPSESNLKTSILFKLNNRKFTVRRGFRDAR